MFTLLNQIYFQKTNRYVALEYAGICSDPHLKRTFGVERIDVLDWSILCVVACNCEGFNSGSFCVVRVARAIASCNVFRTTCCVGSALNRVECGRWDHPPTEVLIGIGSLAAIAPRIAIDHLLLRELQEIRCGVCELVYGLHQSDVGKRPAGTTLALVYHGVHNVELSRIQGGVSPVDCSVGPTNAIIVARAISTPS